MLAANAMSTQSAARNDMMGSEWEEHKVLDSKVLERWVILSACRGRA
jgi:hypothetical protein